MKNLPVFPSEYGLASLTLEQIPYTQTAYIRIQQSRDPEKLLAQCRDFCVAAGAQRIYATGSDALLAYPRHTAILKLQAQRESLGQTDAALFPVTLETAGRWIELYNDKAVKLPNAARIPLMDREKLVSEGGAYFVHRDRELLGIGKVSENCLAWVASVRAGAGEEVVRALCQCIFADTVTLEVADINCKAMALYTRLGFTATGVISCWYQVL